jgi:hypothetical protein
VRLGHVLGNDVSKKPLDLTARTGRLLQNNC